MKLSEEQYRLQEWKPKMRATKAPTRKRVHVVLKLTKGQLNALEWAIERRQTTQSEEIQRAVDHCMDINRDGDCCLWI